MNKQHCPILWGCLQQLYRGPWPTSPNLDDLEDSVSRAPSSHEYSQYRAFLLIEDMLERVESKVNDMSSNLRVDLQLSPRSWDQLSRVKSELTKLLHEAEMVIAEAKLEGTVIHNQWDVEVIISPKIGETNNLSAARSLVDTCGEIIEAIRSLRPYLRNEDAPIQNIPVLYASFLTKTKGFGAAINLENAIKSLLTRKL